MAVIGVLTFGLDRALVAYADGVDWTRASADDWVTSAALTSIGAGVILHVAVGRRWPFATPSEGRPPS